MVTIEAFEEKHLAATYIWMQNVEMKRQFLFSRAVTPESHAVWFSSLQNNASERVYAILMDDRHVGNVGLKNMQPANQSAETWIYLGETSARGKNVAFQAYVMLFDLLRIEGTYFDIYCHIASFNASSKRLFQKLGFSQVKSFVERRNWEGVPFDLIRFQKKIA